jgi:uncharacterized glyoxalase superfamily protein PhnB
MRDMIYPCLTYLDMQQAMAELGYLFGLEIVWVGDDAAEIRWNGGVAVAQTDQPEVLHGSHVGHGWTYVRVADPDAHYAQALSRGAHVLNEPHSTPDGRQRGYSARDREGNLWTFAIQEFGQTSGRDAGVVVP